MRTSRTTARWTAAASFAFTIALVPAAGVGAQQHQHASDSTTTTAKHSCAHMAAMQASMQAMHGMHARLDSIASLQTALGSQLSEQVRRMFPDTTTADARASFASLAAMESLRAQVETMRAGLSSMMPSMHGDSTAGHAGMHGAMGGAKHEGAPNAMSCPMHR